MSTPAEIYAYEFQNSEPKHYTRVPNIIDHLTFIDEDGKSCKLSVYAKELYRIIRMTTSDGEGKCWRSTKNLADLMNCSPSSIVEAKKQLKMPMQQLDGKALILETKRQKAKVIEGQIINKATYCTYTIVDIWKWNNAFMATVYAKRSQDRADSLYESAPPTDSLCESASQGADSPGEPNNKINKKNPLFKEQQSTPSGALVALSNEKSLFFAEKYEKAMPYLLHIGFDEGLAKKICDMHNYEDLRSAHRYLESQREKNKGKGVGTRTLPGYYQDIIKNRYWEKTFDK